MQCATCQQEKAAKFRALHHRDDAFLLPNPWDVGSARLLASKNFEALATTSTGLAHTLGLRDGQISREQSLAHCRAIADATSLPVSGDLENGYGPAPEDVAKTIELASAAGLVGGSIEDHTADPSSPLFDFSHAVERIHAAAEARSKLTCDFVLTARCENFVWGREDLDDTVERLQAYEAAGADVLYAPGVQNIRLIKEIASALSKPLNVVIEMPGSSLTVQDLSDAGAKRISIGSVLFLTAYGALARAAEELQTNGSFRFVDQALDFSAMEAVLARFERS